MNIAVQFGATISRSGMLLQSQHKQSRLLADFDCELDEVTREYTINNILERNIVAVGIQKSDVLIQVLHVLQDFETEAMEEFTRIAMWEFVECRKFRHKWCCRRGGSVSCLSGRTSRSYKWHNHDQWVQWY